MNHSIASFQKMPEIRIAAAAAMPATVAAARHRPALEVAHDHALRGRERAGEAEALEQKRTDTPRAPGDAAPRRPAGARRYASRPSAPPKQAASATVVAPTTTPGEST